MGEQTKTRVLFVCIGNACRSPMGEAIARKDAGDVIDACSAGLYPLGMIPELTRKTLEEYGYPVEGLASKSLREFEAAGIGLVVNMSGMQDEPALTKFETVEEWEVGDPYGGDADVYRKILLEIQGRVNLLAQRLRRKQGE